MRKPSFIAFCSPVIISALLIVLISCAGSEEESTGHFFASKSQDQKNRLVKDTVRPRRQMDLLEIGVYNDGDIEVDNQYLYISDTERQKIIKIDRNTWTPVDSIGNGEGQGPGQARGIGEFTLYNNKVYIPDPPQRKIMVFNKSGQFIKRITLESVRPESVKIANRNHIIVSSDNTPGGNKFHVINNDGKTINTMGAINESANPMRYNGHIDLDRQTNSLYYTGFTEPIIKAFNMDGDLQISINTINNFNTEGNYVKSGIDTENVRYSYSDYALYASADIEYFGDNIIITPLNDSEGNSYNYLDLYDSKGSYLFTLHMNDDVPFTSFAISNDALMYIIKQSRRGGEVLMYNISDYI